MKPISCKKVSYLNIREGLLFCLKFEKEVIILGAENLEF